MRSKQRPEKLAKDLARERSKLRAAQDSIVFDKAVDFLVSKAKVVCTVSYYVPIVLENTGRGERSMDIYSRLLKDRIIFIGTPIDDNVANVVIAQLLFLQMEDSKKDIHLYINSPGGVVTGGMAIYDTINFLQCDVVDLLRRHGRQHEHGPPCLGNQGQALRPSQQPRHDPPAIGRGRRPGGGHRHRGQGDHPLAPHPQRGDRQAHGKDPDQVEKDSDRDYYMSAVEAKEYGIVDHVVDSTREVAKLAVKSAA